MKTLFCTLLSLITIFTCCKKDKENTTLKVDYEISINNSFQLSLASNPSTGYSWKWTNKKSVTTVDTFNFSFVPDTPILNGSGGKEIWRFKGIKSGIDSIMLEYCRSWDANSTVETKKYIVWVK